jgi:hypothetical protein
VVKTNVRRLLQFALAYPYSWHSYSKDRSTVNALAILARDGLIIRNEYRQFRLNVPERYFDAMAREARN